MKTLSIHITDLCNSRCNFCVVGSPLYAKDTVELEKTLNFIRTNAGSGYSVVNIHGGEPTIHPKFFELLQSIKDAGFPEVYVQTNGIKLAERGFVERARSLGVTWFVVSLHAASGDIQDALTDTAGGWERTIAGIENAVSSGVSVRTNTVVMRQNVSTLENITQLACDLGVNHLNYSNLHSVGSGLLSFAKIAPTFDDVREPLDAAVELAYAHGRVVTIEGFPYCTIPRWLHLQLYEQNREIRMLMRGRVLDSYDDFMNDHMRAFGPPCECCAVRERCGGVYREYSTYRGWDEFTPFSGDDASRAILMSAGADYSRAAEPR
jgi:MoaA/NifB/PqqE/SkfB family radical SAM enzyme